MKILSTISENTYLAIGLFCLVMIMTELAHGKKQWHYNREQSERMREHPLNKRYKLYLKSNVNIAQINRMFTSSHIAVIVIAGVIMMFHLLIGLLFYLAGTVAVSYLLTYQIGETYNKFS